MTENNDIRTGGGAAVGGDAEAGRDLVGRDQANQIIQVYTQGQGIPRSSVGSGGRLPLEIELEFRQLFAKMNDELHKTALALVKLESAIETNNVLTKTQINQLQENYKVLQELTKDTDAKVVSALAGLHIVSSSPSNTMNMSAWQQNLSLVMQILIAAGVIGVFLYLALGG